jgi:hypothetical protein
MDGILAFGKILLSTMRTRALRCALETEGIFEELHEQHPATGAAGS